MDTNNDPMNDTTDDTTNDTTNDRKDGQPTAKKYLWNMVMAILFVIALMGLIAAVEFAYRVWDDRRRSRISSVSLEGASSPKEWMVSMVRGAT